MRIVSLSLLALTTLTGCMTLHADIPEDVVRRHAAHEEGLEIGAICSQAGQTYSEGAVACMAAQRMSCDAAGRWVMVGSC